MCTPFRFVARWLGVFPIAMRQRPLMFCQGLEASCLGGMNTLECSPFLAGVLAWAVCQRRMALLCVRRLAPRRVRYASHAHGGAGKGLVLGSSRCSRSGEGVDG